MNLYESIYKIREMAVHAIEAIKNEEATKTALILPMLSALGYDIFNPKELIPEMDCDLTKNGDRLDYALAIRGEVKILIECKHHNVNLSLHSAQLKKYYAASDARCAILTNGLEYWFYSDTAKANIMDDEPFFKFSVTASSNEDIQQLGIFSRESFSDDRIASFIKEREFKKKVLDSYRLTVIKMSKELVSMILNKAGLETNDSNILKCREILASEAGIISAEEQGGASLSAIDVVRSMLSGIIEAERLFSVQYKGHEAIFVDNQSRWLCRINPGKKIIVFPPAGEGDTKDYSGNTSDLADYQELFVKSIKSYI